MKIHYFVIQIILLIHLTTALRREMKRQHACEGLDCLQLLEDDAIDNYDEDSYDSKEDQLPQTQGSVWPRTRHYERRGEKFYEISPKVKIHFACDSNKLLEDIVKRFKNQLSILNSYANKGANVTPNPKRVGKIRLIIINIMHCNETVPRFLMEEKYSITIDEAIKIFAVQVWGVIRALETLLQLCYINDDGMFVINENKIKDSPKYHHRGLMIDTESHYISVRNILKMLDAMAMNKMNVLHWRIAGDTSFPYKSMALSELSEKAFCNTMVYNATDIKNIVAFATLRGIRVIPEFNILGRIGSHTKNFANHHYFNSTNRKYRTSSAALDPVEPKILKTLHIIIKEIQRLFPDTYVHFGGEDLNRDYWSTPPDMPSLLQTQPDLFKDFWKEFEFVRQSMLKRSAKFPIVAQDALYLNGSWTWMHGVLSQLYTQQMCDKVKNSNNVAAYHSIIFSCPYNLGFVDNMSLAYIYEKSEQIHKIYQVIGGEAYLYGYDIDDTNIFERVFPRASAVADILWHGLDKHKDNDIFRTQHDVIKRRVAEHMCRMARLGIPVSPVGPGFCEVNDEDDL